MRLLNLISRIPCLFLSRFRTAAGGLVCLHVLALSLSLVAPVPATGGVYGQSAHGDPATGVDRLPDSPRGSCGHCHINSSRGQNFPFGLWRENDNELCLSCHRDESLVGNYPGQRIYETSEHALNSQSLWPGPQPRPRQNFNDAGKCLNCHNPHGRADRQGLIPELLVQRDGKLCLSCHDGDPATSDVARDMRKPYSHGLTRYAGRHRADEGNDPQAYSYSAGRRHADCNDCHNAHAAYGDPGLPTPPQVSNRNLRVSRVRVNNGGPGTVPTYDYLAASMEGVMPLEYEICFKCHSSWTQQPPGQSDLARLLNPNNPSYHPVEAPGKNLNIDPRAFVNNVNAFSQVYCSDCHGSDDPGLRGPHGSQYANLLRAPYEANSLSRSSLRDELCFNCHNFEVYADPLALPGIQQASRFNGPQSPQGHSFHVGEQRVPCFACHESHGSPRYAGLMVTGRNPGLFSFSTNRDGGHCATSCHAAASYRLNYPR